MDFAQLAQYIQNGYGVVPDFPWREFPEYAVFRHASGKWFCLYLRVPAHKLGLDGGALCGIVNVKVPPEMVGALRALPGVFPAYHMNKTHWVSVKTDAPCDEELLKNLIAQSFALTCPKPRRLRAAQNDGGVTPPNSR